MRPMSLSGLNVVHRRGKNESKPYLRSKFKTSNMDDMQKCREKSRKICNGPSPTRLHPMWHMDAHYDWIS